MGGDVHRDRLQGLQCRQSYGNTKHMQRLGTAEKGREEDRRPVMITFYNSDEKFNVFRAARLLKNSWKYARIYFKRDDPPLVRKEWDRLWKSAKSLRDSPRSNGLSVRLDYKTRKVMVGETRGDDGRWSGGEARDNWKLPNFH